MVGIGTVCWLLMVFLLRGLSIPLGRPSRLTEVPDVCLTISIGVQTGEYESGCESICVIWSATCSAWDG
ncbi:hypothetical protein ASG23_15135 [Cellulomonas sp. Leaf395]|nr:hypothetical protein ASG23_15135 [Cellulomonas sp. Leaf395]